MSRTTTINTMARPAQIHTSAIPATDTISLRDFVVDEDAENFNAAVLRTIDQNAFVLAQREAFESFNMAKAIRLSKETAAAELVRRQAPNASSSRPQHQGSQPIIIGNAGAIRHPQHVIASDEAIALSLARSWQVDSFQPAVHDNRPSPSSSTSLPKAIKISPSSSSYQHQDKKASASIAQQTSRNQLSLSASSFPNSSSPPSVALDSRHHSRSTSQSNTFTKVPSLVLPPVGDQRTSSTREPDPAGSTPASSQLPLSDATQAKRRRTEHKSSVSPPSLDVAVIAPPMSAPQKSSTFSRNLRPGTIIPSTQDNSSSSMSTSEGSKSHPPPSPPPPPPVPKQITAPKQKAYLCNPFDDVQLCPQCGNRLTMPRIQLSTPLNALQMCDALHATCSSCKTRHCRGCTSISPCTRPCSAGQTPTSCAVRNCCYNVRTVAIFEALNVFDHICTSEAGFNSTATTTTTTSDGIDPDPHRTFHSGRQQREAYIKLVISKADKSMRKFEDAFIRTLKIICSWLQYSPEYNFDANDDTSPAFGNASYLNDLIPRLLLASYLPEVIHTFLNNSNVRDWIAHSDTYNMILDTLRYMSNFPTLVSVLNLPLPPVQRNSSLKQWATGRGVISFLENPPPPSPSKSSSTAAPAVEIVESIGGLIKKLEMHRSGLRAFAAKVQFKATLDKVNNLCDGIAYLLLQQVVGGI